MEDGRITRHAPVLGLDDVVVEAPRLEGGQHERAAGGLRDLRRRVPRRAQHVIEASEEGRGPVGIEHAVETKRLLESPEDPPLWLPVCARLDHGFADLDEGPGLEAESAEVEIGALEAVRRREHVVGVLGRRVRIEIDDDEQLERFECLARRGLATHREHGVPADDEERADRIGLRPDGVRHEVAGQRSPDPADPSPLAVEEMPLRVRPAAAGCRRIKAPTVEIAAAAIEITRQEDEHLHQPVGGRALTAHVDARRERGRCAGCVRKIAGQPTDPLRARPDDGSDALGRVGADDLREAVEARGVRRHDVLVHPTAREDLFDHRREQVDVRVRPDEEHLATPGALDRPRPDVDDPPSPAPDAAYCGHGIRDRHEAHPRDLGVRAEHQQEVRMIEVGNRMAGRRAVDRLGARELVGAVLGPGAEVLANAELPQERPHGGTRQRVERARVPDVGGEGLRPVS